MSLDPAAGDPDPVAVIWFEQLFAATYDDLLRYAARRVGPVAAPDVVAEAFLTAWRRQEDYDHDGARLWLFGVTRRIVANADRSVLRAQRLTARAARGSGDEPDPAQGVVERMRVRDVIDELAPAEAEALRLVAWDGFGIAEAAVIAGCTPATFRVRLFRARRRAGRMLAADVRDDRGAPADLPTATRAKGRQ